MIHNTQRNADNVIPLRVIKRNIMVIMPFGSGDRVTERERILDLMWIKYVIEKSINVTPEGGLPDGPAIKYEVAVFREPAGQITEDAVDTLAQADVVVALLAERNINVIYELAIRNLLRDEPILILQGKPDDVLPVYLKDMAYIPYKNHKSANVIKQIKDTAKAGFPELDWNRPGDIPPGLQQAIDASDHFKTELQKSLQKFEDNPQRPPHFLRKHVVDLDSGRVLHSWSTYTPFSVVRIKWQRKRWPFEYDPADMIGKPVVYAANPDYLKMFNLEVGSFPDPDGENPVIVEDMIERLRIYIEPEHYKSFVEDQADLTKRIIFNDGIGGATVPMQFNDKHQAYANEVYLPTLLGKRGVGSPQSRHVVFLAIAFIKDFLPLLDLLENTESDTTKTGTG